MADLRRRLPENAAGEFFVDSTCIDCDTCRQLAPATFTDGNGYSFVHTQPETEEGARKALRALLACPTGSIGARNRNNVREVREDFPLHIADDVFYCGFASPKSFGGSSYFVRHAEGNWLVDSPKFLPHLVRRFEAWGGLGWIFLTHRDDVADAAKYAEHFRARRIIHRLEVSAQPDAEQVLEGSEFFELAPEFLAIPTPGHTRGHCALLYGDKFLFSGDHLWWSRKKNALTASRDVCWYSWPQQKKSMARLLDFSFEWVLPGHGQRVQLARREMRRQLAELAERM